MDMQAISNDQIVEHFGDRHDGIFVYKGLKTVGYLTDLRIALSRKASLKLKQKEYSNKVNEERNEKMPEAVEEMREFLDNNLSKFGCEVFVNITQPNVHVNGCKCYIIVDPIRGKHQLGIMHRELSYDLMAAEIPGFSCSNTNSTRHILFRGMSKDDLIETIKKICLM